MVPGFERILLILLTAIGGAMLAVGLLGQLPDPMQTIRDAFGVLAIAMLVAVPVLWGMVLVMLVARRG